MKSKKTFVILVAVFALLMVGASVLYTALGSENAPQQLPDQETQALNPAPDFTVYDKEGNSVKLSDYFGKPIVLNFWASWCGPCKMEMPGFQEKFLEWGDEVTFLMVNMTDGRETQASAERFLESQEFTFPVFFDLQSNAAMVYRVYSLPTTYFIDAGGNLVAQANGAIDAATLQKGIDMIR